MYEGQFFESFSIIEDRREQGKVRHKIIDIIFIVVSAVICVCNEWKGIQRVKQTILGSAPLG